MLLYAFMIKGQLPDQRTAWSEYFPYLARACAHTFFLWLLYLWWYTWHYEFYQEKDDEGVARFNIVADRSQYGNVQFVIPILKKNRKKVPFSKDVELAA